MVSIRVTVESIVQKLGLFVCNFFLARDSLGSKCGGKALENKCGDKEVEYGEGVVKTVVGGDGREGEHDWRECSGAWEHGRKGVQECWRWDEAEQGFTDDDHSDTSNP